MLGAACGSGRDDGAREVAPTAGGSGAYGKGTPGVPAASSAGTAGRRTLVFVGTSLTAGLGLDPDDAYPALVQRMVDSAGLAWEVVNAGLSGETSAGALRRIDWLLSGPGDVVVVETGANDGLRGVEVDSTRANIAEMLRRIRQAKPTAQILLVQMEAPPNMGPTYTRAFRAMYPALAREAGVPLIPFLLDGVAGVDTLNQADGIHPNETGAKIVAGNVWRALEPVLRGRGNGS